MERAKERKEENLKPVHTEGESQERSREVTRLTEVNRTISTQPTDTERDLYCVVLWVYTLERGFLSNRVHPWYSRTRTWDSRKGCNLGHLGPLTKVLHEVSYKTDIIELSIICPLRKKIILHSFGHTSSTRPNVLEHLRNNQCTRKTSKVNPLRLDITV